MASTGALGGGVGASAGGALAAGASMATSELNAGLARAIGQNQSAEAVLTKAMKKANDIAESAV